MNDLEQADLTEVKTDIADTDVTETQPDIAQYDIIGVDVGNP